VKCFGKNENYETEKYLRLICSRIDDFKSWCGRFIKGIEEVFYHACPWIIKHVPVHMRPALVADLDKHVTGHKYATDWSTMEKHFKKDVMDAIEGPLLTHMMIDLRASEIRYLRRILTGTNKLYGGKGIKASVNATRMSGEMTTALFNAWANYILITYVVESKGGKCEGFVEGDDSIFWTDTTLTKEDFQDLGFDVKVIEHTSASEASFCGIISTSDGTLLRDPVRIFNKFGWTTSMIHAGDQVMNELLRAKALSGIYEAGQCPIIGSLFRMALRETRGYTPRFIEDGYHNTTLIPRDESIIEPFSPSAEARALFAKKFNIGVDTQLLIESFFDTHTHLDDIQFLIGNDPVVSDYCSRYIDEG